MPIGDPIQCGSHGTELIRHIPQDSGQPEFTGFETPRCAQVAGSSALLEVADRRGGLPAGPGLEIIRKQSRHPEREVSHVYAQEETAPALGASQLRDHICQVMEFAVVFARD
jgi:hypothetical protein